MRSSAVFSSSLNRNRVAYEESPIPAGQLLASDADYLPHIERASHDGPRTLALWWPKVARDFPDAFNYTRHTGPKRSALPPRTHDAGGTPRASLHVHLYYVRPEQQTPLLTYETRISDPATWDASPKLVGGRGSGEVDDVWNYFSTHPVRIYAGRADPADASRFTIDFELSGQRGVIDGRVKDAEPGSLHFSTEFEISTRPGDPGGDGASRRAARKRR